MDNAIDNWKILREEYQKLNKKLDDNINFLSFLSINENKHTEFLARILVYKISKIQIFLKSFLSCIFPDLKINDDWEIYTQNNYIDCLIKGKKYAIIIENKVCGAGDQNEQIQRYVKSLQDDGYAFENIFVIYLTLFGGSPDKISLPDDDNENKNDIKITKQSLGKRYAEINYKNEIMNWLENDVLPQCPYREQSLIHSLSLYINYLQTMIGLNMRQQTIAQKLLKILKEKYGLEEYEKIRSIANECEDSKIQEILNIVLRQIEKENIYCNDSNVAYHLKWLLKNNPTPEYKLLWQKEDYKPFNSIGYFTYGGVKHIQLAADIKDKHFRIHLKCDIEGIKHGAYVLADNEDDIKQIWNINYLVQKGFVLNNDKVLILPFYDFTDQKTLVNISEYIANMIKMLNSAYHNN